MASTEPRAAVRLYLGATLLGQANADGSGAWSIRVTVSFVAGEHDVTATATDAAGNASPASALARIVFDPAALQHVA